MYSMKLLKNTVVKLDNNKGILCIVFLSVINLLFMHYTMYFNHYLQIPYMYSPIANSLSVCFDVCFVLVLFYYISCKRIRLTFLLLYLATLAWSFVNVLYSRFFYQYLPLSSASQASVLFEGFIFDSAISGLRYCDLYYLFSIILFCICYKYFEISKIKGFIRSLLCILVCVLIVIGMLYSVYHFLHPKTRSNVDLYKARMSELVLGSIKNTGTSLIDTKFHSGSVRTFFWEFYNKFRKDELSNNQIELIETEYLKLDNRVSSHLRPRHIENVVFVLLESFISAPIDLVIDGKEITPFLNSLKEEPDVYYNGKMQPNITIGESGDGQFIYMTGLLPLQEDLTVQVAKDCLLPALPKLLNVNNTEIVIPSLPNVWEQADMSYAYGISNTYSKIDMTDENVKFVNDEMVFKTAMNTKKKVGEPFFTMVLSISTHMPYDKLVDTSFVLRDKALSPQFLSYLNACHYMDKHLKLYIDNLKKKDLYNNSLIIITADHHAHLGDLNMGDRLTKDLPLFIINGGIENDKSWNGKMNQLDVFTTVLDILNIQSKWHGLGKTILLPNYKNSVNQSMYDISRMIIESDYFRNRDIIIEN